MEQSVFPADKKKKKKNSKVKVLQQMWGYFTEIILPLSGDVICHMRTVNGYYL